MNDDVSVAEIVLLGLIGLLLWHCDGDEWAERRARLEQAERVTKARQEPVWYEDPRWKAFIIGVGVGAGD